MPGTVFVTVGTTTFDALIEAVDTTAMADALAGRGYDRLVMQVGRHAPPTVPFCSAASELDARRGAASSVNPEPYSCHEAERRRGGAPPSLDLLSTAACASIHTRGCCRRQPPVSRVSSQAPLAGSGPLGSPQNSAIASQLVRLEPHLNIRLG